MIVNRRTKRESCSPTRAADRLNAMSGKQMPYSLHTPIGDLYATPLLAVSAMIYAIFFFRGKASSQVAWLLSISAPGAFYFPWMVASAILSDPRPGLRIGEYLRAVYFILPFIVVFLTGTWLWPFTLFVQLHNFRLGLHRTMTIWTYSAWLFLVFLYFTFDVFWSELQDIADH